MKRIFIAAVFMFIVPILSEGICPGYVIDRIEAVVNDTVITKSEVDRAVEMDLLKRSEAGEKAGSKLRDEVVESMIDRILILEDARKFNIVQVTPEEVEKAYESIRSGFPSKASFLDALKKDEITEDELKANLRDQILALKYVDRRVKTFIRVPLDEQKRYYDEHKEQFGGKSFDDVHDEIYKLLVEEETNKKLDEYLKELRSKARITVYH
ncbi:MAG: SurA N-terminal domain-containing protein [Nitrospirota bacterium]